MSARNSLTIAIYRSLWRWTRQEVVRCGPFFLACHAQEGSELHKEWPANGIHGVEDVRAAIRNGFKARKELTEPALGEAQDLGFAVLRVLNTHTPSLTYMRTQRDSNTDRHELKFCIGQVVRHKKYGYRAVVLHWNRRPISDVSGWDGLAGLPSGADQPFYQVLPDMGDCEARFGGPRTDKYVAQENLEGDLPMDQRRIKHQYLDTAFDAFDPEVGIFVPNKHFLHLYPGDAEILKRMAGGRRMEEVVSGLGAGERGKEYLQTCAAVEAWGRAVAQQVLDLLERSGLQREDLWTGTSPGPLAAEHGGDAEQQQQQGSSADAGFSGVAPLDGLIKQLRDQARGVEPRGFLSAGGEMPAWKGAYRVLALLDVVTTSLAHVLQRRSKASQEMQATAIKYKPGRLVRHKHFGYVGVVMGISLRPAPAPVPAPSTTEGLPQAPPPPPPPDVYYQVMPEPSFNPVRAMRGARARHHPLSSLLRAHQSAGHAQNVSEEMLVAVGDEEAANMLPGRQPAGCGPVDAAAHACAPPQEVRFMSPGWWRQLQDPAAKADFAAEEARHEQLLRLLENMRAELYSAMRALHTDTRDGIDGQEVSRASLALLRREARAEHDADSVNRFMQHCAVAAAGEAAVDAVGGAYAAAELNDLDRALTELDRAIAAARSGAQDKECPPALLAVRADLVLSSNRPHARGSTGHVSEALADVDAALAQDPHNHLALAVRGRAKLKLRDYEGAVADLAAAQAAHPWSSVAVELQQARDALAHSSTCTTDPDAATEALTDNLGADATPSQSFDVQRRMLRRHRGEARRRAEAKGEAPAPAAAAERPYPRKAAPWQVGKGSGDDKPPAV